MNNEEKIRKFCELHNFITEKPFIFQSDIWEYDIRQANINMLKGLNRISDEEYNELSNLPKQMREVAIGRKIQSDKTIQDSIYQGIAQSKYQLIIQNQIDINNIIRVANDSIYYNHPLPLKYPNVKLNDHVVQFIMKNHFTEFLNLNKTYVFIDLSVNEWNVDVKGIRSDNLPLHEPFLSFICTLIHDKNVGGRDIAIREFNEFYQSYIDRTLDVGFYREFNATSAFRINSKFGSYYLSSPDGINKADIDNNYNLYLLRIIYSYLLMDK